MSDEPGGHGAHTPKDNHDDTARDKQPPGARSFEVTFQELLKMYRELGASGSAPQITDAIAQALLTVLGSGPSFAALESLISANQANGLMYHNSVSQQQKTNILGMVATAKCVKNLLNMPNGWPDLDLDQNANE